MSGKIPYRGTAAVGAQVSPDRKVSTPTCSKIGYPSRNKNRRMNETTITAKKAVKKNTVLIDCSLRNNRRAVPSEAFKTPFIFFMNFNPFASR
jgi:hypothetical protein